MNLKIKSYNSKNYIDISNYLAEGSKIGWYDVSKNSGREVSNANGDMILNVINDKYRTIVDKYGLAINRNGNYKDLIEIIIEKVIHESETKNLFEFLRCGYFYRSEKFLLNIEDNEIENQKEDSNES